MSIIDPKYTKAVASLVSAQNEIATDVYLSGRSLSFSLASRTDTTSKMGNYFVSFNLPAVSTHLPTGGTLSLLHPETQQLNNDKIIILKIPNSGYSEYIDGRSVELSIPINNSAATFYYKLFSSTYSSDGALKYGETSPLLGNNIAYLFSDNINVPYTGYTTNDIGQLVSHSAVTTWNPRGGYLQRPGAVTYFEVQNNLYAINSDRRMRRRQSVKSPAGYPAFIGNSADFVETEFIGGNLGLYVLSSQNSFVVGDTITIDMDTIAYNPGYNVVCSISSITRNYTVPSYVPGGPYDLIVADIGFGTSTYLESGSIFKGQGAYYNYDIPVGFICLDKGFIVLTHKEIVDGFEWSAGTQQNGVALSSGAADSLKKDIYFSSANTYLKFVDLDTKFKTTAVCTALLNEFYIANNRTWDRSVALSPYAGFNPVYITEIGLFNGLNELVGVAKLSEPMQRTSSDIMTFYLTIEM